MTDIAKTAATQTAVLALELGITESSKKEIIQKHLVAMLAMERERCKEILRYNHTIVAGVPLDPAVPEIIHAMEHGDEGGEQP